MTHNNDDDFDEDFQDAQVQPVAAKKPGMANNLAAAWQGSPLFKLFVLVIGAGALAAAVIGLMSGDENQRSKVSVGSAPSVASTPGNKAPPAYVAAVNEASDQRAAQAQQAGSSALPTPVSGDMTTAGNPPDEKESQYDPLAEFRPNIQPDNTVATAAQQEPMELIDTDLLSKMQQQMTTLFDAWRPNGIKMVMVTDPGTLNKKEGGPVPTSTQGGKVLIPAGTITYAQLLIEANSDVPGPIMAQVMSGPFTGAKVIGEFSPTRDYLILHFTKLTYRRHDYGIDAIAVDPNTTLNGLVTEKDNRYFTRVVLPAAAGFLEGFGSALSSPNTQAVTSNGNIVVFQEGKQGVTDGVYRGISEAAQTAGGFFRDEANATHPLIRVASGTPMGLFFVNSMTTDASGGSNGNVIETPVNTHNAPVGPPIPPMNGGSSNTNPAPLIINRTGLSTNYGAGYYPGSYGSQSSLANEGVNVIQNTPR